MMRYGAVEEKKIAFVRLTSLFKREILSGLRSTLRIKRVGVCKGNRI